MATVTVMTADATNAALALKADAATAMVTTNNLNDVQDKPTARANLNLSQRMYFHVYDYLAKGDGVNDDTVPINNAIAAALNAGGGTVFLPHGTYKTTDALNLWNDNIILKGEGMGCTIIKPDVGANFDVITTPIPAASGTAGYTQLYLGVEDMTLDCSQMTCTTAGRGNGIHFYGVRYSHIERVNITGCLNYGIVLDGDATNFSYSVDVENCRIINGGGGILATSSEEAFLTRNEILQANANLASAQPTFSSPDNVGYLVRLKSGYFGIIGNVIGSSGTYTTAAIQVENSGPTRIIGNRFDQCRYEAIRTTAGNNLIEANQIGNPSSVGSTYGIRLGSSNNIVTGNQFDLTNGTAHYTYAIGEPAAETGNIITDNHCPPGTSGTILINSGSTGDRVSDNFGYNPVGHVTSPTFPVSGTFYTNNFGSSAMVYFSGGTITGISVGGTNVGTPTTVRVPANQTVSITYTGTPTWTWILD